jgi:hypothetical protein
MQQTMPGMSGLSDAAASHPATGASDAHATPAAAAGAAAMPATASIVTGISNDDEYVSSNRSVGVKKVLSRHVIPVEYWIPSTSVWTESAQLSLSRAKTKVGFIYTFWYFLSSTSSNIQSLVTQPIDRIRRS